MKYFSLMFWSMIIVAAVLTVTSTLKLQNRLQQMETNIEKNNMMLKEMTK